jgi:PAS domain S-box-containing protein
VAIWPENHCTLTGPAQCEFGCHYPTKVADKIENKLENKDHKDKPVFDDCDCSGDICLPINLGSNLWGSLCLNFPPDSNSINPEVTTTVSAIVETFGWAIELYQLNEKMESESTKLSTMLDNMEEGVIFADENGLCLEANPFFCRFTSTSREDVINKNISELPLGPSSSNIKQIIEAFKKSGTVCETKVIERTFRGQFVLMRVQPLYRQQVYKGMLLSVIPVTDLVNARLDAENASRTKSRFIAAASHEIRTPLNTIIGFADMLGSEELSAEQHDMAVAVSKSGHILLDIIDDILDLSKVEANQMTINKAPFKPREIFRDLITTFQGAADRKGIKLLFDGDNEIPDTLIGDGNRVRQVVSNLLSNSLKFTESGQIAVFISGSSHNGSYTLKTRVIDTGIGIATDRLEKIFKPFSQADSQIGAHYGGTGLGLAISKHLVGLMQGKIEVKSTLGKGSTFTATFLTELSPVEKEPIKELTDEQIRSSDFKVLIAEDNEVSRIVAEKTLKHHGFSVTVVENGQMAVSMAEKHSDFDAIILDLQMPELDGAGAVRQIRKIKNYSTTFIAALSASTDDKDRRNTLEAGFSDYFTKPTDWNNLIKLIVKFSKRRESPGIIPLNSRYGGTSTTLHRIKDTPVFLRREAIDKLSGDIQLLETLLLVFISNATEHLKTLASSIKSCDLDLITTTAHKIKGAALSVGAARIATLAQCIETSAHSSEFVMAQQYLDLLCDELDNFKETSRTIDKNQS